MNYYKKIKSFSLEDIARILFALKNCDTFCSECALHDLGINTLCNM